MGAGPLPVRMDPEPELRARPGAPPLPGPERTWILTSQQSGDLRSRENVILVVLRFIAEQISPRQRSDSRFFRRQQERQRRRPTSSPWTGYSTSPHKQIVNLESGPSGQGLHRGRAPDHAVPGWKLQLPRTGLVAATDLDQIKFGAQVSDQVDFGRPQEAYRWPAAQGLGKGEHQEGCPGCSRPGDLISVR